MRKTPFDGLSETQILSLCIYGEARGESAEGKIAVASVVLNRRDKGGWFGHTLHEVVLKPYQFSCFLEKDPNYRKLVHIADQWDEEIILNDSLCDCYGIASGVLGGRITRNTEATHYKTLDCSASWEKSLTMVGTIGHHNFYV